MRIYNYLKVYGMVFNMVKIKSDRLPMLYERKEECCGCSACYSICPKSIIEMKVDEEGFEYPTIIMEEDCIRCFLCIDVCPIRASKERVLNER